MVRCCADCRDQACWRNIQNIAAYVIRAEARLAYKRAFAAQLAVLHCRIGQPMTSRSRLGGFRPGPRAMRLRFHVTAAQAILNPRMEIS